MQVIEIIEALERLKTRGAGIIFDDSGLSAPQAGQSESSVGQAVLFCSARDITRERLNELLSLSGSQVFVTVSKSRRQALQLGPMLRPQTGVTADQDKGSRNQTLPLLESVEAREGIHTGISVADRTATIQILASEDPNPRRIVKPGHIFPLEVVEGGVLVKPTLFEAASDLVRLYQNHEVSAVIDLLDRGGEYPDKESLLQIAKGANLPVFSLSALVVYRLRTEPLIEKMAEAQLPVRSGKIFKVQSFRSKLNGVEHVALSLGDNLDSGPVLTRVHRERLLTDLFESDQSSGNPSLQRAIEHIEREGRGLIVYLRSADQSFRQEKPQSFARDALFRQYGVGAQIIKSAGVKNLVLLSNSAAVPEGLENFGLEISAVRKF